MGNSHPHTRCPRRRWPIGLLAVLAASAAACGSSSAGSTARVAIHALVHRSGCPVAAAPRDAPFRGAVVFSGSDGRRPVAHLDQHGRAALTLPAGNYRVAVSGPPRARRLVRAWLDGRALPVAAAGRFPVTIGRGDTGVLAIIVSAMPAECNALGASG
jgi:hypothetical protein